MNPLMLVGIVLLILASLYVLFYWFYARAFSAAIKLHNSIPDEYRGQYVIRTDWIFPVVGKYPPEDLQYRTRYSLFTYQDPEVGTCFMETCRILTDEEMFG